MVELAAQGALLAPSLAALLPVSSVTGCMRLVSAETTLFRGASVLHLLVGTPNCSQCRLETFSTLLRCTVGDEGGQVLDVAKHSLGQGSVGHVLVMEATQYHIKACFVLIRYITGCGAGAFLG